MSGALYARDQMLGTLESLPDSIDYPKWSYRFTPHPAFAAHRDLVDCPDEEESDFASLLSVLCFWSWGQRRRRDDERLTKLDALDLRVVENGLPDLRFHFVAIHGDVLTCRCGAIRDDGQPTA